MSWLLHSAFSPSLPEHCSPQNDFLIRYSSVFHTCVPTPLAFLSSALGALSIVAWLFAQLPQIYKNWSIGSTSGLSIFFLVEWCLGDCSNLLGALFTHQAPWQVAIGAYYVFVDLCLVGQWIWYEKLKHGHPVLRIWKRNSSSRRDGDNGSTCGSIDRGLIEDQSSAQPATRPRIIFRPPTFVLQSNEKSSPNLSATPRNNAILRVGSSSPMPSPSPRTVLMIACLIAMAHASPLSKPAVSSHAATDMPTPLENAGTVLSWMSTFLYLGSRLPQLLKNWRRKSTAGLSPHLFIAAFCGNLFYSSALLANPCAWNDFGPHGGGGWVGREGTDRVEWTLAALPFFLGAFGVLGLDASVGVQFLLYGETSEKLVVVQQEHGSKRHLRRVSGWLRGWVPSFSEGKGVVAERQGLLPGNEQHGAAYGTL